MLINIIKSQPKGFFVKIPQFIKSDNLVLHLILIVITAAVVWGLTCGLWSLRGVIEGYYISAAKEILAAGGSVFTGESQTMGQQPPLVFWLFAFAIKMAGDVNSLAPRLVSVVFAFITLGCTYYCGRRLISPKAGLYSAFILATCPVFMLAATKVAPNMVFAGLITLSITAIITKHPHERAGIVRAVVIWLGMVLAFLAMGLMAPVMIILFIILFILAQGREIRAEIKRLWLFSGILAGVVLMAVWLVVEYYFTGNTFVQNEFSRYGSLFTAGFALNNWWFYFSHAGYILGIWSLGLIIAILMLIVHKVKFIAKWYLWLFWFVPGFVILCFAPEKNIDFILPLLPPVALFIGYYLSALAPALLNGKISGSISTIIGKLIMLAGIVICTLALICFAQLEFAWQRAFYVNQQGLIIAFILGLILVFIGSFNYKTTFGALFGAIVLVLLVGNAGLNAVVNPALDVTKSSRYFSQNLQKMYPELEDLGLGATHGANLPQIHIYNNYNILPINYNADMFGRPTTSGLPDFILMPLKDYAGLTVKPELGGFAPVFWDTVAGTADVVLLKRQTGLTSASTASASLIYVVPKPLILSISPERHLQNAAATQAVDKPAAVDDENELKDVFGPNKLETAPNADAKTETTAGSEDEQANEPPVTEPEPASAEPAAGAVNDATPDDNGSAAPPATEDETPSVKTNNDAPEAAPDTVTPETAPAEPETPANGISAPEETPPATDAPDTPDTPDDVDTQLYLPVMVFEQTTKPSWSFALVSTAYAGETALPQPEKTLNTTNANNNREQATEPPAESETAVNNNAENAGTDAETAQLDEQPNMAANAPAMVLNAEKCVLAQGFMLINGNLTPYYSNCASRNVALLNINTYQPNLVRFYSVNLQNGFGGNAYALHWFKTQAGKFKADYNMLVINNIASSPKAAWPYTNAFNQWVLQQINMAVAPKAVFFTGINPVASEVPAAVFNITGLAASNVFNSAASQIQIDFDLHQTTLRLEFDEGAPRQTIDLTN